MKNILIDDKNYGQRIDKYLLKTFPQMPKSFLYKMFRKKNIKLNQKRIEGHEILQPGDEISIYFSDETYASFAQSNRKKIKHPSFSILYEDEDVLIVSKPNNLLSQPNGKDANLVDEISSYLPNERIGIVTRLDRNTTGAVIIGKNVRSLQLLNRLDIQKTYHAVLCGVLEKEILLEDYLSKEEKTNKAIISSAKGKRISTLVIPMQNRDGYTLARILISAGKTHQIRAHLAEAGYPIVGDPKYGNPAVNREWYQKYGLSGQLLHCYQVSFQEYHVIAPHPTKWNAADLLFAVKK